MRDWCDRHRAGIIVQGKRWAIMSNLLKALKRAERDREAIRQAQAENNPAIVAKQSAAEVSPTSEPQAEPAPAVVRLQRDAVKASERVAPRTASPVLAASPYRGVGISLTLAVLFAMGVGWWMRGRDTGNPPAIGALSSHDAASLPAAIPAALRVNEVGPLQLRLDRGVDAVGEAMQRRGKAQ